MILGTRNERKPKLWREWTRWFAWRPVRLMDGRWAWLCHVARKQTIKYSCFFDYKEDIGRIFYPHFCYDCGLRYISENKLVPCPKCESGIVVNCFQETLKDEEPKKE